MTPITRRNGHAKVQSERQLRPSLFTMTRWDSERELGCDRPPQLKKRNHEEQTTDKLKNNNPNMLMVKAQSESHLSHCSSTKRRWKPNGTAAGVDRPPTLKHGSSFGSSALFNASFPLRSRSGDMNEPLFGPPSPPPVLTSSAPSSPKFPSSTYLSMTGYKTKDSFITTTTSPSSVMSCFDDFQKQDLVSFLVLASKSNNNNNIPMRTLSCHTMPPTFPNTTTFSLQRHSSSSSCMTTFDCITTAIALMDDMKGL